MKTIATTNPQNPHTVSVDETVYSELAALHHDGEIYIMVRNHAPNGSSLPNRRHLNAMLENIRLGKHRDNPTAWRVRELYPTSRSYERGIFRHPGQWVRVCDELGSRWENETGDVPNYKNAESYPS